MQDQTEPGSAKVAVFAVIYGIVSVFAGGFGAFAAVRGLPLTGVTLIIASIVLFGWSCFVQSWFFRKKG
jgi:CHASE2 domain-containing sensor protein